MKTPLTAEETSRAERLIHRLTILEKVTASDVREILAAEFLDQSDHALLAAYAEELSAAACLPPP